MKKNMLIIMMFSLLGNNFCVNAVMDDVVRVFIVNNILSKGLNQLLPTFVQDCYENSDQKFNAFLENIKAETGDLNEKEQDDVLDIFVNLDFPYFFMDLNKKLPEDFQQLSDGEKLNVIVGPMQIYCVKQFPHNSEQQNRCFYDLRANLNEMSKKLSN